LGFNRWIDVGGFRCENLLFDKSSISLAMTTIKEELGSPGEIAKSLESSKTLIEASPKEDSKNRGWPKGKKRYPKGPGEKPRPC
jgi:hypothetical protein